MYIAALYSKGVWHGRAKQDLAVCMRLPLEEAQRKSGLLAKIKSVQSNGNSGKLHDAELAKLLDDYEHIWGKNEWYWAPNGKCDTGQVFKDVPEYFVRI